MRKKHIKIHIGLRTIKTAVAVIAAMAVVDALGATTSPLIFAMLGAMSAMEPTFKDSLEACVVQTASVLLGALASIVLLALKLPMLATTGIGIILVITFFNVCRIRFSPSLACLIVVTLCTADAAQPLMYAARRIWDTAIGMIIGMGVNTLIFPYDNSNQIRTLLVSLDQEVIRFLEDVFDGDDVLPDVDKMTGKIDDMARQLKIFGNQRLVLHLKRQKAELEQFQQCEGMARELLARMEVLSRMGRPGRLNDENRQRLKTCGAEIRDRRTLKNPQERDIVTNYHVRQILSLRAELLGAVGRLQK